MVTWIFQCYIEQYNTEELSRGICWKEVRAWKFNKLRLWSAASFCHGCCSPMSEGSLKHIWTPLQTYGELVYWFLLSTIWLYITIIKLISTWRSWMRLYIHELGYPSLTISMKISLIPCKLSLIPLVPSKYTMKLYTTSNTNCNLNPLQTESRSEDGTEQRMRTLGEVWETGNFIVLKTFTAFQVRSLYFSLPPLIDCVHWVLYWFWSFWMWLLLPFILINWTLEEMYVIFLLHLFHTLLLPRSIVSLLLLVDKGK